MTAMAMLEKNESNEPVAIAAFTVVVTENFDVQILETEVGGQTIRLEEINPNLIRFAILTLKDKTDWVKEGKSSKMDEIDNVQ